MFYNKCQAFNLCRHTLFKKLIVLKSTRLYVGPPAWVIPSPSCRPTARLSPIIQKFPKIVKNSVWSRQNFLTRRGWCPRSSWPLLQDSLRASVALRLRWCWLAVAYAADVAAVVSRGGGRGPRCRNRQRRRRRSLRSPGPGRTRSPNGGTVGLYFFHFFFFCTLHNYFFFLVDAPF